MIVCSAPGCQTTAGCQCNQRPKFGKSLSDYTDEEIAREYYWRTQKKLGDPRIGVSFPVGREQGTGMKKEVPMTNLLELADWYEALPIPEAPAINISSSAPGLEITIDRKHRDMVVCALRAAGAREQER